MNDKSHDDFDHRLRAMHARAVAHVPPRTVYELQVRRRNAATPAAGPQPRHHGRWVLAGGLAAAFALAIGLQNPDPGPAPGSDAPPRPLIAAGEAAEAAAWDDNLATLDEDPDLYLWLASQDTLILAME